MISLPNNCKCSEPNVFPTNWKQANASTKKDWYISYYFYDANNTRKKVIVKSGINRLKTAIERKRRMVEMLQNELDILNEGGNPVTKEILQSDDLTFIEALKYAAGKVKVAPSTAADIKSLLNYATEKTNELFLSNMQVKEVKRKHILQLIDPIDSPHKFNKYRSYLSILFESLIEPEIIDTNPCLGIKKRKTVKKLRDVMTLEERAKVNDHLKKNYYTFWRFMQIFYHSGAREIELLRLKVKDVDLINQRFKVTVLKGRQPVQMWRTIKDIALPFWLELLKDSQPKQYIFSEQLQPGNNRIRREQITRRWHEHVKVKLGIDKTFYSIKHSAATDTAELLGNLEAAKHMGHADETMVKKVYNVEYENRKRLTVKELRNEL